MIPTVPSNSGLERLGRAKGRFRSSLIRIIITVESASTMSDEVNPPSDTPTQEPNTSTDRSFSPLSHCVRIFSPTTVSQSQSFAFSQAENIVKSPSTAVQSPAPGATTASIIESPDVQRRLGL